jgi:hypothetical protein
MCKPPPPITVSKMAWRNSVEVALSRWRTSPSPQSAQPYGEKEDDTTDDGKDITDDATNERTQDEDTDDQTTDTDTHDDDTDDGTTDDDTKDSNFVEESLVTEMLQSPVWRKLLLVFMQSTDESLLRVVATLGSVQRVYDECQRLLNVATSGDDDGCFECRLRTIKTVTTKWAVYEQLVAQNGAQLPALNVAVPKPSATSVACSQHGGSLSTHGLQWRKPDNFSPSASINTRPFRRYYSFAL